MRTSTNRDSGGRSLLRAAAMLVALAACRGPETFRGGDFDAGAGAPPTGGGGTGGRISVETGTGGDNGGAGGAISSGDAPGIDQTPPVDPPLAAAPPAPHPPKDASPATTAHTGHPLP